MLLLLYTLIVYSISNIIFMILVSERTKEFFSGIKTDILYSQSIGAVDVLVEVTSDEERVNTPGGHSAYTHTGGQSEKISGNPKISV